MRILFAIMVCIQVLVSDTMFDTRIDGIKTIQLQTKSFHILNEEKIDRGLFDGYRFDDVSIKYGLSNNDRSGDATTLSMFRGTPLTITNNTPRSFSSLNILIDGTPIRLKDWYIQPFTRYQIVVSDIEVNSSAKIVFLDPNPVFTPNVLAFNNFSNNNDEDVVEAYKILQNHIRYECSKKITRNEFYWYFFDEHYKSRNDMLSIWYKWLVYDTPKNYIIYYGNTSLFGVANGDFLSINWPINHYLKDKRYSYIYEAFLNIYSVALGLDNIDIMKSGWSKKMKSFISNSFDYGGLVPGELHREDNKVFWAYDRDTSMLRAYSIDANRYRVGNIFLISKFNFAEYITVNEDSIKIDSNILEKILVNADIFDNGRDIGFLANYIIPKNMSYNPFTFSLNQDYDVDALFKQIYNSKKNFNIKYYFEDGLNHNLTHQLYIERGMDSVGQSHFSAEVFNENGKAYKANLIGTNCGHYRLVAPCQSSTLKVVLGDNPKYINHLPSGKYHGLVKITAQSDEDEELKKVLILQLNFEIGDNINKTYNFEIDRTSNVSVLKTDIYDFNKNSSMGFTQTYFVTPNGEGPTSRVWWKNGYSTISVPVYNRYGKKFIAKLRGYRQIHYGHKAAMNTGANFYNYTDAQLILEYHESDNPYLPFGSYQTEKQPLYINVKGWHNDDLNQMLQINLKIKK